MGSYSSPNYMYDNNTNSPVAYSDAGSEYNLIRNVLTPPSSHEDSSFSPAHITSHTMMSPEQTYIPENIPMDLNEHYSTFTSPTYLEIGNGNNIPSTHAKLIIIEQPTEKFRFRYKSEMAGTHGSINGSNSDKSRKQTFPTVELKNYTGSAKIRCSIYQCNAEDKPYIPHAHRLVMKQGTAELDDPHHKYVSETEGFIATFPGMGIIHTAKKNVVHEIQNKKMALYKENIARKEKWNRDLNEREKMQIRNEAESESRSINLNIVVLKFEAFSEEKGILYPICQPVYSNQINNLKSALTGELKIVRMDHCSGNSKGGKEVILLVEKVTKKNIKIRFFELDDSDCEIWEDYGKFNDLDVHHQYAIVFRTPRYRDLNIDQPRKVYLELVRPSDNARSEPKEFTFIPSREYAPGSKRSRNNYYSSSMSFSSNDLPLTVANLTPQLPMLNSEELTKNLNNVSPEDFSNLFLSADPDFKNLFATDGGCDRVLSSRSVNKVLTRVYDELICLLKAKPKRQIVIDQLKFWLTSKEFLTEDGNNALHLAALEEDTAKFFSFLKLIDNMEIQHMLEKQNNFSQTVLHIVTEMGNMDYVQELIRMNINLIPISDQNGNTALHIAVKSTYKNDNSKLTMLNLLLTKSEKDWINRENYKRFTAVYIAVKNNDFDCMKNLCEKGANVNVIDRNNGRSMLHLSILDKHTQIVEYLVNHTNIDLTAKDFNNFTPYKYALNYVDNEESKNLIAPMLFKKLNEKGLNINIKEENKEIESDDEMEVNYIDLHKKYRKCIKKRSNLAEEVAEMKIESPDDSSYCSVDEFNSKCLNELSNILNEASKWKALADILDLSHLLETNLFDNKNPTKVLLNNAIANGFTVLEIKKYLESINEHEAVICIEKMVINCNINN